MTISQNLLDLPIVLENGPEKVSGSIMKMTPVGLLVELEAIPFKVGTYLMANFQLDESTTITEKVRSIKHYDKFYRTSPKKAAGQDSSPPPKRLCEVHFHLLSENSRVAMSKYLLKQQAAKQK